jgi:hypothetical protein
MPYPFQIVQGDGDIMFVYEYATSNRTVRMTNHLDPKEVLVDQWLGWSNGRWEGDTLVVDVFGQIRDTWLDRAGNHHNGMTVEERYTPMTENHIWYEATITDPRTFSRPWKIAMPLYRRMEPNAEIYEYKCVEFAEPLLYGELLKEPTVAGAAIAAGAHALAHHSFASEFDANRPVEVVGVVKEMRFSNPHSWIYLTVKTDSGEVQDWAFEGAAPNALLRRGFNRDSLPAGTEVRIRGFQARDRTNRAAGTQVTLVATGLRLFVGSTGVGTPGDPTVEGGGGAEQ